MTNTKTFGIADKAPRITIIFSTAFLVILFLLHFLEPEFDPPWRMISEYELGHFGWMMSLAFFCWGISVLALLISLTSYLQKVSGMIVRMWLVLLGVALFGAGIFKTNPILDTSINTANTLHTICGAFVIMTFPMVASLISGILSRNSNWSASRHQLMWGTILVWLSMFAYFGSIIVSNAINPLAGRVGPEVYMGWPNRIMVVIYHGWLIYVALRAKAISMQDTTL